jgi:hypothetical protein
MGAGRGQRVQFSVLVPVHRAVFAGDAYDRAGAGWQVPRGAAASVPHAVADEVPRDVGLGLQEWARISLHVQPVWLSWAARW